IARDRTRQFELADDLSLTAGAHQLKFGGDYRAILLDHQPFQHSITYETPDIQTLVTTDAVSIISVTTNPASLLTQSFSAYAQDNWKANSRIVLTYGIRWELVPAPSARGAISLNPPYSTSWAFDPHLKLPRSYQWNGAMEKSFGSKQSVSVTYVGQSGRNLLRQEALFMPNPNFSGDFLLTRNDAASNYNALQSQYRRPLSDRVQAVLNYTWSHSLDNASNDVVAGLSK